MNLGGGRFLEAGYALGIDLDLEDRAVAVADLDRDGAIDLIVRSVARRKLTYLHNRLAGAGRFLRVDLQGTRSNRDAVGAVVRLKAGDLSQVRVKTIGNGFQGQSEGTLHFGLGATASAPSITVRWPSGLEERFDDLPADRRLRIVEGGGWSEAHDGAASAAPRSLR